MGFPKYMEDNFEINNDRYYYSSDLNWWIDPEERRKDNPKDNSSNQSKEAQKH